MNRAFLHLVLVVAACIFVDTARGESPDTMAGQISRAIDALGSRDPAKRQAAAESLLKMGSAARPALLEAAASDDPAIRAAASQVLQKLPWFVPGDSPDVRDLLNNYGRANAEGRREIISSLAQMNSGVGVLARLMVEEPSDTVRWAIVSAVRQMHGPKSLDLFRKLETQSPEASAVVLAAAGHAWIPVDVPRGAALLKRSLDAHFQRPADDGGEVDAVFARLGAMALIAGRLDEAAQLRRRQATMSAREGEKIPPGVLELFSLHACLGPLPGFERDVKEFEPHLMDGRVVYCMAEIHRKKGEHLLAGATSTIAFALSDESPADRLNAGNFLYRQGWMDWARLEWKVVLAEPAATELDRANAHFRLALLAVAEDDDAQAAEHYRQAMRAHQRGEGELQGTSERAMEQEIRWRDLRGARKKGDAEAAKNAAAALMALQDPSKPDTRNTDVAIDLIQYFEEQGQNAKARELFEGIHAACTAELKAEPDHPQAMNNVAWLCARLGRKKEEALDLAKRAVAAMPDNPALLDTLAEASFVSGRQTEAIALEEQALRARPGDLFMKRQLDRFKHGK